MEIQRKTERKGPDSGKVKSVALESRQVWREKVTQGGPQDLDQNSCSVPLKEHLFPDHLLCAEQGLGMERRC